MTETNLNTERRSVDHHIDADFAQEVLADLYTYPPKNEWIAFALWLTLGWFGAHRFYLERNGTALLMMLTGGGGLVWWIVDGFVVRQMARNYNVDQDLRRRSGHPPRQLDFMPPLSEDVLSRPPEWTERWRRGSRASLILRLLGDSAVLLLAGMLLGIVAVRAGVYEAIVAIVVLAGLTVIGAGSPKLNEIPVARSLVRWSHRLRLFYYYNKPGHPLVLLFRPLTGPLLAPFRLRDRAEVRLYLQLGGVFALLFLLADLAEAFIAGGWSALGPMGLLKLWIGEATKTFVVIYAFATPIGAVLTLHLLMRRTHFVPRVLSVLVISAMALGLML